MQIGSHPLKNNIILAPMSGITDRPFRDLCSRYGAGLTVSEMVASQPHLQNHKRTLQKIDHQPRQGLHCVQILGTDPQQMAEAARINEERGADIIDINMGCPAKKVCSVAAGSALLKNEALVENILNSVVESVSAPVTLKIRTGWDKQHKNAVKIAEIAEKSGIQALTIHGRTRACKFEGNAEYDTIKAVKQAINIPVIANGDIDSPEKAATVLEYTGADAVMIGRAAQGKPWIFKAIADHLNNAEKSAPSYAEMQTIINQHLEHLYSFYGNISGVRIARKHIAWYLKNLGLESKSEKQTINQAERPAQQLALVNMAINQLI